MTDRIDTFTERGIGLESGRELEADITVTATGLNLLAFGGITFTVNGEPANLSDKVAFKAHRWFFRSDSKSSSEHPSTPAAQMIGGTTAPSRRGFAALSSTGCAIPPDIPEFARQCAAPIGAHGMIGFNALEDNPHRNVSTSRGRATAHVLLFGRRRAGLSSQSVKCQIHCETCQLD